jgi:DNA-directed RNA polymerase subunit N (RpoN/RPB10)
VRRKYYPVRMLDDEYDDSEAPACPICGKVTTPQWNEMDGDTVRCFTCGKSYQLFMAELYRKPGDIVKVKEYDPPKVEWPVIKEWVFTEP